MSEITTQPLEIKDFSFGITDYFMDGDPRHGKSMKNLILTPNGKLRTRWGSVVAGPQLPLGAFRVSKIAQLKEDIFCFQEKRCYRLNGNSWSEVLGPSGGSFLPIGTQNAILADASWRDHVFFTSSEFCSPQKLFVDGSGVRRVTNAGLPDLPSGFSVSTPSGTGSSYLYAALFSYPYQVNTVLFLDRGPVFFYPTAVVGGAITNLNTTTVTLPTALSPQENWDFSQFKIEIYRTQSAGTEFYKVGEVNFGTSSFIDNIPDSELALNELLYTTGGAASNTTPPKSKFVHVVNEFGYWAHIKTGTEISSTEIRQSKAGDPDSVPEIFSVFSDFEITGISSIFDRPLVFTTKYIYRIDSFFGDDGTGGMELRRIDDKAGCVSHQSIVQTHLGAFWAGNQGFYWTDGFRVFSISDHLNETYKKITSSLQRASKIVGAFDPGNQRVSWAVSFEDGAAEPDAILILDLRFSFEPSSQKRGGSFTSMEGGSSFRPTSILQVGDYLYRGDTRGYLFKHGIEYFTDPKINTLIPPAQWDTLLIEHEYSSCFVDFGSKFYRKWVPRILVSADNATNLSLAIGSSNDNNRVTGTLRPIRYKNNITWGESLPLWGDAAARWNYQGLIEEWRRFPSGGLRCNYKQISFTNAKVEIVSSSLLGQALVNPATNTATLTGSFQWIPGITDYTISFSHDNYAREFKILSHSSTTLVYEDITGVDPVLLGMYDWQIKGRPKGEVLLLNGYVIHWAFVSKSHTPYSQGGGA